MSWMSLFCFIVSRSVLDAVRTVRKWTQPTAKNCVWSRRGTSLVWPSVRGRCLSSPRRPRARARRPPPWISWLFDCHVDVSRQVVSSRPLALTLLPREVNRRLHKQKGIGPRRSLLRHKLDITMSMATVFARRFAAGQVRSHKPGF